MLDNHQSEDLVNSVENSIPQCG